MSKKKIKPVLKLSAEIENLYKVLQKETDMACVLIGTSYISELLGAYLKNKFIEKSSTVDKILMPDKGFLGGFINRAEMAYCLGIIDKEVFNDLKIIAEIRNEFAHSSLYLSFSNNEIKELCNKLESYRDTYPDLLKSKDGKTLNALIEVSTRNKFNHCITLISQRIILEEFHAKIKELKEQKFQKKII